MAWWSIWLAIAAWVLPILVVTGFRAANPGSCYQPAIIPALLAAVPAMLLGTAAWDRVRLPRGRLVGWAYWFGTYGAMLAMVVWGMAAAASAVSGYECPIR